MNAQVDNAADYFWVYVLGFTIALVGVIALVKLSESEKYAPIKQQLAEDARQMNIRVLRDY